MIEPEPTQPRRPVWVPALLALVTLIAFGGLGGAEFSNLDDNFNLYRNPRMNPPTWETLSYYWTNQENGLYIPLTYTVWAGLAKIGQVTPDPMGIALNPWLFHAANIGIHVLSVLAVYALLTRLLKDERAACIGALLFAIHPVQVESVAWVAGLKDVLAGLLGIVAIWMYVSWAQAQPPFDTLARYSGRGVGEGARNASTMPSPQPSPGVPGEGERSLYYLIGLASFILAMFAKPSALVIPFIAGIIDVGWLGRSIRAAVKSLWPWMVLSIVCGIVGRWAQPATGVPAAPIWARPLIMLDALAFYLYKLVFPLWLGVDYGRKPSFVMGQWWFWATWIVPVGVFAILWFNRRRWRELLVAGAIFVAAVGPVLGLVTFLYQYRSTTADHYLYMAMLGPALAAGWVIKRWPRGPAIGTALVVLLLLGTMMILQTQVWADDLRLFSHARDVNPRSAMALHNLGYAYFIRGRSQEAVAPLARAIELDPTYAETHELLATVLKGLRRPNDAIEHRLKAIELVEARPPELQEHLTAYYVSVGLDLLRADRLPEARELLLKALNRDPENAQAREGLKIVEERISQSSTKPNP